LRIDSQEKIVNRSLKILIALVSISSFCVAHAQTLKVATSFSILEDFVKNVGGNRVSITNFVPRDGDAHTYQPGTQDVRKLAEAQLVFINGLGLEAWFQPLLKNASSQTKVVTVSSGLTPRTFDEDGKKVADPHAWWNLANTIQYVRNIQRALSSADPAGAVTYKTNADRYARALTDLDAWAKKEISSLPITSRKLVTNHDALGYFAQRYGFQVIGDVIPSLGTEQEPSAKAMAQLSSTIRSEHVKAIFTENTVSKKLAETIASESGTKVAPPLYTDALGPIGSSGETFLKAFRYNVSTIVGALK
jgi:zinc/manganese transport system substrate-binding protein